ncbi:NAD(P)-dependent oxidoreductase [Pararhizobium haloflavum]|uniref:NAD(P)-dependent oxidoreductase n=1 Tax=Pararhizobium haloflavum TaxID=2037914 RepID=UPI000C17A65E|nr:NAD(P)-dependent oxidoreductase [Pararhizobium haloflavum]
MSTPESRSETIGFVGLGMMGAPMARALGAAGHDLVVHDVRTDIAETLATQIGCKVAPDPRVLGEIASIVITMLPNGKIVRSAVLDGGIAEALPDGAVVIDMSSSEPLATRELGEMLAARGVTLVDAPVSGGVRKAVSAELAIMLGGDDDGVLDRVSPVLGAMGRVFRTGRLGSGHALKALNNYVSAAGLAAACEALIVGEAFGLDPERMVDVLNQSTGRNNSTENKLKPFVLSEKFREAGFAMDLMAKDVGTAADLADALDLPMPGLHDASDLWKRASEALGQGADHTEIYRFLDRMR